jgi:hypothetical protein
MKLASNEKRAVGDALKTAKLLQAYHFSLALQACNRRSAVIRRCVACDSRVTAQNLGGNDGRSALTGPTWCYRCADKPCQLVLRLGP